MCLPIQRYWIIFFRIFNLKNSSFPLSLSWFFLRRSKLKHYWTSEFSIIIEISPSNRHQMQWKNFWPVPKSRHIAYKCHISIHFKWNAVNIYSLQICMLCRRWIFGQSDKTLHSVWHGVLYMGIYVHSTNHLLIATTFILWSLIKHRVEVITNWKEKKFEIFGHKTFDCCKSLNYTMRRIEKLIASVKTCDLNQETRNMHKNKYMHCSRIHTSDQMQW